MMREIARLNFEGKLQAVAEEKGKVTRDPGVRSVERDGVLWSRAATARRRESRAHGARLVAQLRTTSFWWPGSSAASISVPPTPDKRRQFLRVEEGIYENGVFKFLRIWNGDETDWGLNFGAEPMVLRVSLGVY